MCAFPSNPGITGARGPWGCGMAQGAGRARPRSGCSSGVWPLLSILVSLLSLASRPSCLLPFLFPFLLVPCTSCSPWPGRQAGQVLGVSSFHLAHGKVWLWGREGWAPLSTLPPGLWAGLPGGGLCPWGVSSPPAGSEGVGIPPHHLASQGWSLGSGRAGEVASGRRAGSLPPPCFDLGLDSMGPRLGPHLGAVPLGRLQSSASLSFPACLPPCIDVRVEGVDIRRVRMALLAAWAWRPV